MRNDICYGVIVGSIMGILGDLWWASKIETLAPIDLVFMIMAPIISIGIALVLKLVLGLMARSGCV